MYLIELYLNIVPQAALYLDASDLQYSLCTVLQTDTEDEISNELLAALDLTLTNHTQFKELNC